MASRNDLPPELAMELLADFHNRKDPWRLAGAIALATHSDQEVREQSLDLVRFLIGEEATTVDAADVLSAARRKLLQMSNQD